MAKARGRISTGTVTIVAAVALLVGTVGLVIASQRYKAIQEAQTWQVAGPPCPTLDRAGFLTSGYTLVHAFDYEGVHFDRAYGYVNCDIVDGHGGWGPGKTPVCQFNNPSMLEITTKKGAFYFFPRNSHATISVVDDVPSCVRSASVGLVHLGGG